MKKKNTVFQILKCIAIIMVIDDHCATRIGFLSSVFPYNSFYMPMFVFISGYFYKEKTITNCIMHKAKSLLLPYIVWSFVGLFCAYILKIVFGVKWYTNPFSFNSISQELFYKPFSGLTEPSWFALMLFWVSIIYNAFVRFRSNNSKQSDFLFCAVFILTGFACIAYCMNDYGYGWKLFALRTLWYIQFYHFGTMFRKYWEKDIQAVNPYIIFTVCILINVILIITDNDINFYSTLYMHNFNSWWIPLVTSVTGTLFWYEIAWIAAEKFGQTKAVDFIADNTFTIMSCHLLFVNIPNFYAYFQHQSGNPLYVNFNSDFFVISAGMRYNDNTRLIGFFCGLIGGLLTAYMINKVKKKSIIRQRNSEINKAS